MDVEIVLTQEELEQMSDIFQNNEENPPYKLELNVRNNKIEKIFWVNRHGYYLTEE